MGVSMIDVQREAILKGIRDAGRGEWKVLVVDSGSWRLISNILKEDDILDEHITNIEQIEQRRPFNREMDAIYLLNPESHIVDCVMADLESRRYRRVSLLWTSLLHSSLRQRIDRSSMAQAQILQLKVLDIGYFPRESNVVTFRDPWSFPILYHPACNNLVRQHMSDLSQRIVSVCVSLGEYPTIRYYRPPSANHEASVLCSHLARFVQEQIDMYATYHDDFPPPSTRPRGALYIVDRSMDLVAPLVHEFTYQAMVHDLLPINDGDKVTFRMASDDDSTTNPQKDVEITEKDKLWIANRHRHMKDTIETLMGDFQKFVNDNPHFTKADAQGANDLNIIKDMLAGLPQFKEMKEAYSLHLTMAQESMNLFQARKLPDVASVEQSLATGLDEDYKKAKNMADSLVRLLDEECVVPPDRLRLILLYLLYRDGILPADTTKLLAHAQLPQDNYEMIRNFSLLGARVARNLKDPKAMPSPLFQRSQPPPTQQDDYSLSRFDPALKYMLNEHARGVLDQETFPYTKPQLDADISAVDMAHSSLRSAKPTWASRTRAVGNEQRQRVLVFVAGGCTYSEARACYEVSEETNRDVYLMTSHMLTPSLFLRQVGDLSVDKRRLGIPAEQPKPKAPAHLFEPEPSAQQTQAQQAKLHKPPPSHPQQSAAPAQQTQHLQPQSAPSRSSQSPNRLSAQLGNLRLGSSDGRPRQADAYPAGGNSDYSGQVEKKFKKFFKK